MTASNDRTPNSQGYFGRFGGRFLPETVLPATEELCEAYEQIVGDEGFQTEFRGLCRQYAGRPTPLGEASRLGAHCGGARIFLKREDLAHTGSHKINNALGQALLAQRMGKERIIAETGAGQHGVATAAVCAMLGLSCRVYMGEEDVRRQPLNVLRMKLLGAEVVPVTSGTRTLKDAINEALRDWVTNVATTHYLIGSVVGPHPYPALVRSFQSIIGHEARAQVLAAAGRLPHSVVACVGGGSNAIGIFYPFLDDPGVCLVGVEAAGRGLASGEHAASLCTGKPGVLHGSYSYVLQDGSGQILGTHSISAGLDYPGVGPEHSFYKESGRAGYTSATDEQALQGLELLSRLEGIIPALETAHAIHVAAELAGSLSPEDIVLINISGRGDKDMQTVAGVREVDLR